jgi:hypothetical protein
VIVVVEGRVLSLSLSLSLSLTHTHYLSHSLSFSLTLSADWGLDLTEEEAILIGLSHAIFYEKGIELNLSGNKVHYANSLILPANNMLCSKLHYQVLI